MHVELPKAIELEQKVFNIHNEKELQSIALEVFRFQFGNNSLYRDFCRALHRHPGNVVKCEQIPFLPISFFKTHAICTTEFEPEMIFTSSGTTGITTSSHYVRSLQLYRTSFLTCFKRFYGDPSVYCILGLLPSYLEREGSSLVYMVDQLVKESGHADSGFYLHDTDRLDQTLEKLENEGQKTLLIGVTYALLDFGRSHPRSLKHCNIMETGGMKGRKKEMTRQELYGELRSCFGTTRIYSEYGMTELLSQAYAVDGKFLAPSWMKVFARDETDPLTILDARKQTVTGGLNIIDLANIYSCSFIATEDIARIHPDESFEVLGRMDHSDIRGCSLLAI
ncbi:MAG TPA: acyl transferase [Flavisolibacter sp.]